MKCIQTPISDVVIQDLKIGDRVLLSGTILTARDAVHKWLCDTFIDQVRKPQDDDSAVYEAIKPLLAGGVLYHCGPIVAELAEGDYQIMAAGPTTSMREEPFQAKVMQQFNVKAVIGKGGMGKQTLQACQEVPAVYLHAVGGAAALIAEKIQKVKAVFKLEFGVPEAIWVLEVEDFPLVVSMDSKGNSLHAHIEQQSREVLEQLLSS
ncbi:MAG: fumarate hydratase C-terminal domain-containing protein [Anaerolineaceae bacterium]|nr:fumarate hydratase C-terminal domain-containing protein [Anaerolineaceae bacterium]